MVDASVLLQQVTAAMVRPRHATRVSGLALKMGPRDSAPTLPAFGLFTAFPVALLEREVATA